MENANEIRFETQSFNKRLKTMLKVDFRRMFTMPLFYIMVGASLIIPILILVMTTAMGASVMTDPTTGEVVPMETFTNVWQAIGSVSGEGSAISMDLTGMCNINLIFFLSAVLVCLFISDDFRSGYAKNLFAVRSKKTDYVISKILVGFISCVSMLLAFFVGALLGGAIAKLSFDTGEFGAYGIFMCMLSKIFLMGVFVSIYVTLSVAAKQRSWLSLIGSFGVGMLLFMMIPMMTPLDSGIMNVILCLAGSAMFGVGLGAASNLILKKTSLV